MAECIGIPSNGHPVSIAVVVTELVKIFQDLEINITSKIFFVKLHNIHQFIVGKIYPEFFNCLAG